MQKDALNLVLEKCRGTITGKIKAGKGQKGGESGGRRGFRRQLRGERLFLKQPVIDFGLVGTEIIQLVFV